MNDTGVIDRFFQVFSQYIDSGFGLLGGEVAFLATTLVAIDVTLAALFWSLSHGEDVLARLIKKTLFVGLFAFLIGNFQLLADIVFRSFAGLGLQAGGGTLSAEDFLRPGKLASAGIEAGRPLLEAASELSGFPGVFENLVQILVLLAAFLVVIVAFFVLAVQLFVTLIEFKLTTLAGFILVPFGLLGHTAFLAERVLGNVVASGVKVLVLAVIVGIGSTLMDGFVQDFSAAQPTLEEVLALALGALALLGLGIFGPGIATGLVSGAPQLGAGAAVGTGAAVAGLAMAGAAGVSGAAGAVGGLGARGAAGGAAASAAARPTPEGGPSGPRPSSPSASGGAGTSPKQGEPQTRPSPGPTGSSRPSTDAPTGSSTPTTSADAPTWARQMKRDQAVSHGVAAAAHALRSGDSGGSAQVSLKESD
ncbi:P-type conjugative transfer protein TrbL [Brevundimonas sp. LM2]|uniref:P-type conjugative transfer protein TrbL n=1 Tax=Brevundimonas sp. LM2 TaxID=1938605 RepID=UPI000983BBA6|nr:P-type conjugative transfer protein TrbL [Brevundimonas sp. LM2]AQR61699.1 P-type conjugative transfer protein TrbL [Brevundimonas sp. LM2]